MATVIISSEPTARVAPWPRGPPPHADGAFATSVRRQCAVGYPAADRLDGDRHGGGPLTNAHVEGHRLPLTHGTHFENRIPLGVNLVRRHDPPFGLLPSDLPTTDMGRSHQQSREPDRSHTFLGLLRVRARSARTAIDCAPTSVQDHVAANFRPRCSQLSGAVTTRSTRRGDTGWRGARCRSPRWLHRRGRAGPALPR